MADHVELLVRLLWVLEQLDIKTLPEHMAVQVRDAIEEAQEWM